MAANRTEKERTYLLDAIDAFNRKIVIISFDYQILAANATAVNDNPHNLIGRLCHEVLFGREKPCANCPAGEVLRTGKSSLRYHNWDNPKDFEEMLCLFSYPVVKDGLVEALVMLDLICRH